MGANSDLPWEWMLPEILLGDSSLLLPAGVYCDSPLLGNYINHQKENIAYIPLDPVSDHLYIADLILDSVMAGKRYLTKFHN